MIRVLDMRQVSLITLAFIVFSPLSGFVQAENAIIVSNSPKSISQAMDLAVRSNSLRYLNTQEFGKIDNNKENKQMDSTQLKSPEVALLLAVFPGFIVHGAGHLYAKKPLTSVLLFGMGTIGGVMVISGSIRLGFAKGFSKSGNETASAIVLVSGGILFFGSWIYDIVRAPKIIEEHNERLLYKAKFNLKRFLEEV